MSKKRWFVLLLLILSNTCTVSAKTYLYKLKLNFLTVGVVSIEVEEKEYEIILNCKIRTVGIVDLFFKVRDRMNAHLKKDLSSFLRYSAFIREGGYKRKDSIVYYPFSKILVYYKNGKLKRKRVVEPPIYDPLSSAYVFTEFVRTAKRGKIKVATGKKDLWIEYSCSPEVIRLKVADSIKDVLICDLLSTSKTFHISKGKTVKLFVDGETGILYKAYVPTSWGKFKIFLIDISD